VFHSVRRFRGLLIDSLIIAVSLTGIDITGSDSLSDHGSRPNPRNSQEMERLFGSPRVQSLSDRGCVDRFRGTRWNLALTV